MKLYEMPRCYEKLYLSMSTDDDVADEEMVDALSKLDGSFRDKVENCAKVLAQLSASAEGCANEIARLTARKRSRENKAKWLKGYIQECMYAMGMNRIDGDIFRVSIQKNPVSVLIEDEDAVPEEYYVTPDPKISKTAIKESIDAGNEVPGCSLKQTESLRVR